MNPYLLILLEGLVFVAAFGGLTQIRREGVTTQFIAEGLGVTALALLAMWLTNEVIHPVVFLVVIYLITVRVRLTVDIANLLAGRGRGRLAMRLYDLAAMMAPDVSGRVLIDLNRGALLLASGQADRAIPVLENILSREKENHLGYKHEAACRYNLGAAYLREKREGAAVEQLNQVIDLWPGSRYANQAESLLRRRSQAEKRPT